MREEPSSEEKSFNDSALLDVESNDSIKLQAMDFFELKVSLIEKILLLDEVIAGVERALEEMEIQIIAQLNRGKFHSNRR